MHTKLLPKINKNLNRLKKYRPTLYQSEESKLKKYSDSLDLKANPLKQQAVYDERRKQIKLKARSGLGRIVKLGRKRFHMK